MTNKEKSLLSRRQHILMKIRGSILILLLIVIILYGTLFWSSINWYYKILLTLIAYLIAPSSNDLKDLLQSYENYKKKWEDFNNRSVKPPPEGG
ncbi:MAG: hypothetical protein ABII93_05490 [Chrysiogenia bacterium]